MERRGFTLVELLIVLAVGAILLAIALPSYGFLVNTSRLAAVTNDLVTALHLSRSEAVKRGMRVTVCKTSHPGAATPACEAAASWHEGWLVFVDGGVRGVVDGNDQILWIQARAHPSVSINGGAAYSKFISYLPNGRSQGSNNFPNGTIQICAAGSRRDIIINKTGRPRLHSDSC